MGVEEGWAEAVGQANPSPDINNAPTAQLLSDMRNGQQLRRLTSSGEASRKQCRLEIAITLNPFFLWLSPNVSHFLYPERESTDLIYFVEHCSHRSRQMFIAQIQYDDVNV